MKQSIGKELLQQLKNSDDEKREATVKLDGEALRLLEKWPLGRTLKERVANLIAAGSEYLDALSAQEGEGGK